MARTRGGDRNAGWRHHFEEARRLPACDEHLRRAADRDVKRLAHREAAARLTHAVALTSIYFRRTPRRCIRSSSINSPVRPAGS